MTIPWFLMACYAYEMLDHPILTDGMFDHLAGTMYSNWETIQHRHKHLIAYDGSSSKGSSINIIGGVIALPEIIKGAARQLAFGKTVSHGTVDWKQANLF